MASLCTANFLDFTVTLFSCTANFIDFTVTLFSCTANLIDFTVTLFSCTANFIDFTVTLLHSQHITINTLVDSKLSWKPHIQYISSKISKNIAILQKLIKTINISNLHNLYYSLIYPYLFNGISVWGLAGVTALSPVIKLQKRIVRLLSCSTHRSPF